MFNAEQLSDGADDTQKRWIRVGGDKGKEVRGTVYTNNGESFGDYGLLLDSLLVYTPMTAGNQVY